MNYTANRIYTYIEGYVNTLASPVFCSSKLEPIPSRYPACYIRELNQYRERKNITLAFDDVQHRTVWNVMVFTDDDDTAMTSAYEIMSRAETAFNKLGFIETSKQQENTGIANEYRLTARFERVVCDEDTMPST